MTAKTKSLISVAVIDPDHYRKLQDYPVQRRVHSLKVDPQTHRVYAPEEQEDNRPVARMVVYEASAHVR